MNVERQQGGFYQQESPCPDQDGKARSLSVRHEEPQAFAASDPARALAEPFNGFDSIIIGNRRIR